MITEVGRAVVRSAAADRGRFAVLRGAALFTATLRSLPLILLAGMY
jgi:hypothetical protein